MAMLVYIKCVVSIDSTGPDKEREPSSWLVVMLALGGALFFYASGHDTKFSRLRISSAFVGFDEFQFFISGALLAFDTFAPTVVVALGPLALVCHDKACVSSVLSRVVSLYAMVAAVSTVFVGLQRRHLMVWAIFAPKFAFDVFTLTSLCLVSTAIVAFAGKRAM
mmetsp:Transcript_60514/g.131318  ORF Transcript_60514/g.131318 Transcript_60514/m.131318 type:complete len:165 (+) Transcript_60514:79-573(+)